MPSPRRPSETGTHSGRPYWLWLPDSPPPWPGVVIVHGAGSRKENHGDFGRAAAGSGWAAVAYDQRGHGASADEMGPGALGDVAVMARLLAGHDGVDPARVVARGSSMGGYMGIHATAASDELAGVIAVCPASEDDLRRGLRRGDLEFRAGPEAREALGAWLAEHDIADAVARLAGKPVLLLHAEGDERIPSEHSRMLFERAGEPRKLIVLPGGHHRSAQHDAEMQGESLRWMAKALTPG